MATQIIEFELDAGETLAVKLTPATTPETEFTADEVDEVRDGLYQATFDDQSLPIALYRIEVSAGAEYLGRGLVNVAAASGLFRETIEATAAVNLSEESLEQLAGFVVTGINAAGVAVATALPAFIAQLRAANIIFRNNPPQMGPMTLYSGCDHLQANGNGKSFRNPAGTWPNLSTRTIYLEVVVDGKSTRDTGVVIVPTGTEQEVVCQMQRSVLVDAGILHGNGTYLVVAETEAGQRFPMRAGQLEVSYGVAPEE